MSAEGKVIHTVSRWDRGRYVVESLRDAGDWRWEQHMSTDSKETAITEAESLVRKAQHSEARVVDRDAEEDES